MALVKSLLNEELKVEGEEEEEIPEKLVNYDLAVYPSDLTIEVIQSMWRNGDISIPDYQRHFVWTLKQASLLIDSFLLGLPVPQVFLYIDKDSKGLVVDGLQRLMSIVSFLDGYFGSEDTHGKKMAFRLRGLPENSPYEGKTFSELPEAVQRKLKSSILRVINIRQLNPKGDPTSVYHIFERLNTGGTPLSTQEIRTCVYRVEFVKTLKRLNLNPHWREIVGKKPIDKRMKDEELILRIFSLWKDWGKYEKPMKTFLDSSMGMNQNANTKKIQQFVECFPIACKEVCARLGKKPFHVRGPLNSSVLDAVFCTLLENLDSIPHDFKGRYKALVANKKFEFWTTVSTSDVVTIQKRFKMASAKLYK